MLAVVQVTEPSGHAHHPTSDDISREDSLGAETDDAGLKPRSSMEEYTVQTADVILKKSVWAERLTMPGLGPDPLWTSTQRRVWSILQRPIRYRAYALIFHAYVQISRFRRLH